MGTWTLGTACLPPVSLLLTSESPCLLFTTSLLSTEDTEAEHLSGGRLLCAENKYCQSVDPSLASYSLINGTTQKIYDCGLDIFIAVESTFHFLFSKVDCGLLYCYLGLYALDYISFVKLSVSILDN